MAPTNLRFLPSHEWVAVEGTKARVGITDFAVAEIKDVVYVDLPAAGGAAAAGQSFGAIETVKAAFDLYAPVSGKITAVNAELAAHPETVSRDPFGAGWMLEIEVADAGRLAAELAKLLDAAAYEAHCRAQGHH